MNNNMIFSKTVTRKRPVETSISSNQNDDSAEHPVERLFQSIQDPNKYKLMPLIHNSQKRRRIDPHGRLNKIDHLTNSMRENFSVCDSSSPWTRNSGFAEMRKTMRQDRGSDMSTSDGNNLDINHGGCILAYGTAHRKELENVHVLDEDPLGSEPIEDPDVSKHTSCTDKENSPPQCYFCKCGAALDFPKRTIGTQTVTTRGTQTLNTMSRGSQTHIPGYNDFDDQADSICAVANPFRFEPSLTTCRRPSGQTQHLQSHNSENQTHIRQSGSLYGASSLVRFDPFKGNPRSFKPQTDGLHLPYSSDESCQDLSVPQFSALSPFRLRPRPITSRFVGSTWMSPDRNIFEETLSSSSSGQTVAEERVQLSLHMKLKERRNQKKFCEE